jgi:hypothetical protein
MLRRHLGKIIGYSFSPIEVRVGRGDIWRRLWELLENRMNNKPNGCSAKGALAPGPDYQQQRQQQQQH